MVPFHQRAQPVLQLAQLVKSGPPVDLLRGDARPGRDARKWCVGIAVDSDRGQIYWTQKGPDDAGLGRIFRANVEIPKRENPANRTDIEVLFDALPEPIDLELDLRKRLMYWTDRGDPPRGNTVNRAPMDADSMPRPAPDILLTHLMEGIGIALDLKGNRMFLTDLAGSLYSARLDGSEKKPLLVAQGNLTGIAYAELPAMESLYVFQQTCSSRRDCRYRRHRRQLGSPIPGAGI